jgi:hypothetical protein
MTEHLRPYLKTRDGRAFLAKNIDSVDTKAREGMVEFVNSLRGNALIVTDSSRDYAEALARKHGFSAKVIGNAGKPFAKSLPKEYVLVGDAVRDVFQARRDLRPCIAITGGYSTREKLEESMPQAVVDDVHGLEDMIVRLERGLLPPVAGFMRNEDEWPLEEVSVESVGDYIPYGLGVRNPLSGNILIFKRSKDYDMSCLLNESDDYFWQGSLRKGPLFEDVLADLADKAARKLETIGGAVLAMPNSLPSCAYRTDTNQWIARVISSLAKTEAPSARTIERISPLEESHTTGVRTPAYESLRASLPESDHVVLFDDVCTSGTSLRTAAGLLRRIGYSGRISALVLGKTSYPEAVPDVPFFSS